MIKECASVVLELAYVVKGCAALQPHKDLFEQVLSNLRSASSIGF